MSTFVAVTPPSSISVIVGSAPTITQSIGAAAPGSVPVAVGGAAVAARPEPLPKPRGMAHFKSSRAGGSIGIQATTTSGFLTIRWWDGQVRVVGPATAAAPLTASRAIPATGDWSGSSPKDVFVWSGNRTQSGDIVSLTASGAGAYFMNVSDCDLLETLDCSLNSLPSLDVSRTPALRLLSCHGNQIRSLDLGAVPLLRELYCQSNLLTSLDLTANRAVQVLQCNNNAISALSLAGLAALTRLYAHFNLLAVIDLSPAAAMFEVNLIGNLLTSVRASGLRLSGPLGGAFSQNRLSAQALNLLYSDLAATTGGALYVTSNPGTTGDTPTIATSKGYAVYGT